MPWRTLLGRARELADLEGALDQAIAGHGSVFLVSGEAGIGKSRLAEEIARSAERRGATVLWGRASEVAGAPPCWPWVQLLRASAEPPASGLDVIAMALERRDEPGSDGEPEAESLRLGLAIVAWLRRSSAVTPLVLVFDDLHASDLASLSLLQVVARELRAMRVLVVGTYREIEARRAPRVSALLAAVAREGVARSLPPLDVAAVAQWIGGTLGGAAPATLVAAVFAVSEGNPLFVDALAQLLAARGASALLAPGFALPDTIRETVHESLVRVSPEARNVLDMASVLGRECIVTTLAAACSRSVAAVLAAVDEGIAAGVLSPQAVASSPARFAHVLVREAVYQALPLERRVALHATCALALERVHASDRDAHIAELAHHAFEGAPLGSWQDAADACARAGVRAMDLLAFDDASRQFERALIALERAGSTDEAGRADLLWRLGVSLIRSGHVSAGQEACQRSAALAEQVGRPEIYARAALAFGAELVPGRVDQRLVGLLESALLQQQQQEQQHGRPSNEELRPLLMARLAAALMPAPSSARALALSRAAIEEARRLGTTNRRLLAQVINTARAAMTPADDLDERTTLDRELAGLAAGQGDRLLEVQARGRLVLDGIEEGDSDAVRRELATQQRLATEIRVPQQLLRAASMRLLWSTVAGSEDDAARAEAEVRELADGSRETSGLAVIEANRFTRAELGGDVAGATAALQGLKARLASEPSMGFWLPFLCAVEFTKQGDEAGVRAQLAKLVPVGARPGATEQLGALAPFMLVILSGIFAGLRDPEWMEIIYARLLPFAGRNTVNTSLVASLGPVDHHLARLAAELGRRESAAAHLREAIALSMRAGFPAFEAQSRRALAALEVEPPASVPPSSSVSSPPPPPELQRQGDLWTLKHDGREARLRDSKGLHYLAALLREPGREFHAGDLVVVTSAGAADGEGPKPAGDAGVWLDDRAKAEYRQRLHQLKSLSEDAEERGDREGAARFAHERETLARELAHAVGLGGRDRRASSASERARINVQRRLRDVIQRVSELDASMARHLDLHIKTGIFCSWQA